jgi:hypothetical protein
VAQKRSTEWDEEAGRLRDAGRSWTVPDLSDIGAADAAAAKRTREAQGLTDPPPRDPGNEPSVQTGPIASHVANVTFWLPGWVHRLVLATAPLSKVPELGLEPDDCLQADARPFVVLGQTEIYSLDLAGKLTDGYKARASYPIREALDWTRAVRADQLEREFKTHPGAKVHRLERKLEELKARGASS